ncbi:MAG: FecR domain-containing protein [Bacteroidales bacterium]|nr:FecR domain-containing protein [Bacteroidales bacterium]
MEIDRHILEKFFMNEAESSEVAAIEAWLKEDKAHEQEFQNAYDRYVLTNLTVSKMELKAEMARVLEAARAKRSRRILAYVASVAAALAVGAFLTWNFVARPLVDKSSQLMTFTTEAGQRATVTLPDGTSVQLNSCSELRYPAVFSDGDRRVYVEGEAMFDVAKETERPFVVETFAYDIKVLGTKFNVIAEEECQEFCTALIDGRVSILNKEDVEVVELRPDQIVKVIDGKLHKIQSDNVAAQYRWTDGVISCSGQTFEELMRKFERSFGVNIEIEMTSVPVLDLRRMKVNVNDGIVHAFSMLKLNAEFEYEYDDKSNTYYIR